MHTLGGMGLILVAFAGRLSVLTGLPDSLLLGAGLALFPVAVLMALTAVRGWNWAVPLVLWGNAGWILASVALLPVFRPSAFGTAFVVVQAAVVLALVTLEWRSARGRADTVK